MKISILICFKIMWIYWKITSNYPILTTLVRISWEWMTTMEGDWSPTLRVLRPVSKFSGPHSKYWQRVSTFGHWNPSTIKYVNALNHKLLIDDARHFALQCQSNEILLYYCKYMNAGPRPMFYFVLQCVFDITFIRCLFE